MLAVMSRAARTITSMPEAAFFDLDKTVIAKSSTLAFGKPFYKAGFVGRRTLMKMGFGQLFYVIFGADEDTLERARDQMLQLVAGWHRAEIEQLVEETLEEVADPLVYAEALTLIDDHKRNGRRGVPRLGESRADRPARWTTHRCHRDHRHESEDRRSGLLLA